MAASTLRSRCAARRHTTLLVAIVGVFAVRPFMGDSEIAPIVFSFAMLVVLSLALYNIQIDELVGEPHRLRAERRRRTIVGVGLALVAFTERVAGVFYPSHELFVVGSVCWLALLGFVTWSEWRSVVRQKEVTAETLSMSISVYLLMGLTWGLLYAVIFYCQPHAFSFGGTPGVGAATDDPRQTLPILIYFSLTTLSTIGYGDITPVTVQARFLAVAEGITGQLYLAILVARLVGIAQSQRDAR